MVSISCKGVFVARVKYGMRRSSLMAMILAYMSWGVSFSQMALPQDLLILRPSVPSRKTFVIMNDSLSLSTFCKVLPACMLKV